MYLFQLAVDPSQQQVHHHLARALMHLNQPATFLPFFHSTTGLGLKPTTILRPSQSHILSSPSHICSMHFLPDRRPQHPWHLTAAFLPTMYSILNLIYRLFHTHIRSQTFHHHLLVHLEQRKDILTMTRHFLPILRLLVPSKHHALLHPRSLSIPPAPSNPDHTRSDIRSTKRPRTASHGRVCQSLRHPPEEPTATPPRPAEVPVPEPEADPAIVEPESCGLQCRPIGTSESGSFLFGSVHPHPNLDPAIVDHRNRPWPPCDDRELAQYKMDTKSRPSWKTIAKRMNLALLGAVKPDGRG